MGKEHEIILYQIDDTNICVNVVFQDETFWLNTRAMAELFGVNTQAISKHLGNIYEEEELTRKATCSKMEQVQMEGEREIHRKRRIKPSGNYDDRGYGRWNGRS